MLSTSHVLTHLNCTTNVCRKWCPYFIGEKNEAQTGEITCLETQERWARLAPCTPRDFIPHHKHLLPSPNPLHSKLAPFCFTVTYVQGESYNDVGRHGWGTVHSSDVSRLSLTASRWTAECKELSEGLKLRCQIQLKSKTYLKLENTTVIAFKITSNS